MDDNTLVESSFSATIKKFDKEITALLVIDPYNDFISEGGKVWGTDSIISMLSAAVRTTAFLLLKGT